MAAVQVAPSPKMLSPDDDLLTRVTVRRTDQIRPAAEALNDYAASLGLRAALCEDVSSSETMVDGEGTVLNGEVFGWLGDGERWWEDHLLALHSPLPRACRYESEPFWGNADGFVSRFPNPYLDDIRSRRFFELQFHYSAAIVVPVHLPFGQVSANSFVSVDRGKADLSAEFAAYGEALGTLTRRFIASFVAVQRIKRRLPSDCELSRREVECLRWASLGKTDREIGMIIALSHATVRYHINRAGEKLNSVNRAQTIFKAGQLGYLAAR